VALRGEPTDRSPLAYLFFGGANHVLERIGSNMGTTYRDAGLIAQAQCVAAEMFGHDAAMVPFGCLTVEAEAFGCEVEWHDNYYPRIASHPLASKRDLKLLRDVDPSTSGRMPLVLGALGELRARAGDDLFIVATVTAPFLVAAELRGTTQLLSDFVLEPSFADDLLDLVSRGTGTYVREIAASGTCDAIMFENAGACREMMGPTHAERFVWPYERRLISAARGAAPDIFLIEHNCSETPFFDQILGLDVDAVSFSHGDIRAIAETHGWDCLTAHPQVGACIDRFCLKPTTRERPIAWIGNVDNTRIMLDATPEEIEKEARACIASAQGAGYVLSTGCEIPFKAPLENILALSRATR
jgi:uroporphyrinogen decarboxylase